MVVTSYNAHTLDSKDVERRGAEKRGCRKRNPGYCQNKEGLIPRVYSLREIRDTKIDADQKNRR